MAYKNSNKILSVVLSIVLVLVIAGTAALVGVLSDGFTNWDKFKKDDKQEQPLPDDDKTKNNGGMTIPEETTGNNVKLMSARIAQEDYEEYGISPLADSAYTLTAMITPSDADNKGVDWSVAFVNPSSAWASGKTVTEYVTITPQSDGSLTATVTCLKAFGEQVKITVISRDYSEIKADCTVDYAKKISSLSSLKIGSLSMSGGKFLNYFRGENGSGSDVTANPVLTDGSITDSFSYKATMCINKAVSDALKAKGFTITKNVGEYFEIVTTSALISNAISNYPLVVQGPKRAAFMSAMRTLGTGAEIGSIKLVCTGSHSTYEKVYPIVLDSSCTVVTVTGIDLDKGNIVF